MCDGVTLLRSNLKTMKRCADPLTKEEAEEKIEKEEQKAVAEETQEHKEEAAPCENKFVVFHFFHLLFPFDRVLVSRFACEHVNREDKCEAKKEEEEKKEDGEEKKSEDKPFSFSFGTGASSSSPFQFSFGSSSTFSFGSSSGVSFSFAPPVSLGSGNTGTDGKAEEGEENPVCPLCHTLVCMTL